MTSTRFGNFRLAKMQTMQGRESEAFNAELQEDGKTVAHVSNDGNGGCHRWYWTIPIGTSQERFHTLAVKVAQFPNEEDERRVGL